MNISKEDAEQSISLIENTRIRTIKSVAAAYASPILILWGSVCFFAYLGTHFFLKWVWQIWMILDSVGALGTFLICYFRFKKGVPTKIDKTNVHGLKIILFWVFLFVYIAISLSILKPYTGLQLNAFIVIFVMFAYIIIGLWTNSNFMILLGLAATVSTLIAFYLIPHQYYSLWMAFTIGFMLAGTGVLIHYLWK
jgi:hypothetical protein